MEQTKEKQIFEQRPVPKAVFTLAVPTVISQLIVLIYNLADTWFIGQTGDTLQVAAVTVSYPIFMLLSAFANLFGIGGGSLISRLLGSGKEDESGKVGTFALWAAGSVILASIGMSVGGILNIILDPIFIFSLHMNVAGAALATCLSNTVSICIFCSM